MQVSDLMNRTPVSVSPATLTSDLLDLLLRHRLSDVPVLESGRLTGTVGERDLLHRHELGTGRDAAERPWWVRLFAGEVSSTGYVESRAACVADIMRRERICIDEDAPLAEAVRLFERHATAALPVLRGDILVGSIARHDFVRALAERAARTPLGRAVTDAAIRHALLAELESQPWWHPTQSQLSVLDGVVHFYGLMECDADADAARVAAQNIVGVQRVVDHRLDAAGSGWGWFLPQRRAGA